MAGRRPALPLTLARSGWGEAHSADSNQAVAALLELAAAPRLLAPFVAMPT